MREIAHTRTTDLVQRLQAARRDLVLEAALAKLDRFDLIILDDIGYAQKDQAETSVLFELIARRYETRSIAIAANQPFSAWDRIFPDKAVTVDAIDRLVHHATILEMNVDSYRRRAAADRTAVEIDSAATTNDSLADNHNHPDVLPSVMGRCQSSAIFTPAPGGAGCQLARRRRRRRGDSHVGAMPAPGHERGDAVGRNRA